MAPLRTLTAAAAALGLFACQCSAEFFYRLGACPKLGCILPPDQADFLPGQYFDIRLEIHAPQNGSERIEGYTEPDQNFTFTIQKDGEGEGVTAAEYFSIEEPEIETWNFTWYEDLFAVAAETPSAVEVASKAYRRVALYEPGHYIATLTYQDGETTVANWTVRDIGAERKAKNVILFVGDGMTTNMITAARLIGHQQVNGVYQTKMALDQFPVLGHQMTHSLDSFITDSANSATSLYAGHKTTVNALGVYADSSEDPFDDPKFESVQEIFHRLYQGGVGIVTTAFVADATPGAVTAHTRLRGEYGYVVDSFLHGTPNYTWSDWEGVDVLFGGGAEQFIPSEDSFNGDDYFELFAESGYTVVQNASALNSTDNSQKHLGIFSVSNMAVWLDRNIYPENLNRTEKPDGSEEPALDQPGLKEMTLKALDVLHARHPEDGFVLMSEAASIDKQMHTLDYDRSLGELLELDDTVKATLKWLEDNGELENTLVLVTADHGHGFDVAGNVDTQWMNQAEDDREKRSAVGIYEQSGLSGYQIANSSAPQGSDQNLVYTPGTNFPVNWDPRYTLFDGLMANPDRRENYQVHKSGPRRPAINVTGFDEEDFYVNYVDAVTGFIVNGTLPVDADQGVHSLTDVPVFAQGPCQELFGGVYNNIDIFFGMAECLGLGQTEKSK
ncbi:uncharacterized protein HMPREF1541_10285 [Cyphellophora europaea CBS 101466]|uniref:alkaline phosphatase n=1 Tax=Cyphellophora europaea (strain CBS 101466) TaxID=1220924 RepID=W2S7K4_CYPE1|nr:uncharacterized protein HMPREF1541_10285 [Cyphellophora europaea CBS 101466]ETN44615.1 hypothetical protein HMPREF1541_10285 [Cyphellophora europaea CBS 101466]